MSRPHLETLEERNVPSTFAGNYIDGVWRWDATDGWGKLSGSQATVLDVSDSGDVYGQFADGLWRWSDATFAWQLLTKLPAESFEVTASGVLYGDFQNFGVWRWSGDGGWMFLTPHDPIRVSVSDADVYYGRFDAEAVRGAWRWSPADGWLKLTNTRPDQIFSDDAGNFIGRFDIFIAAAQQGTWRWNSQAGWSRLSTAATSAVDVSDDGTIYENRGANGLWRMAPGGAAFSQVTADSASGSTPFALPGGDLYYDYNYSPGNYSGWIYRAATGNWSKIINSTANIYPAVVGTAGDLFLDAGAQGTGYWSAATGYFLLGNQNPTVLASQR